MTSPMLQPALDYHNEGLNAIPIVYREKKPALPRWEEYHNRISTEQEIYGWFGNGHQYNVGLVHCRLTSGIHYTAIDIDHDSGICDRMFDKFSSLFMGRIEQSGSGEGYHIPLLLNNPPLFGNKTWKTQQGNVNLRISGCQTVAPPSIHPTGGHYRYLQNGKITTVPDLDNLIIWLNEIAPPADNLHCSLQGPREIRSTDKDDLLEAVKDAWPTCLSVFAHFGMAQKIEQIQGGKTLYLRGYGGLKLSSNGEQWFIFCDSFGGGPFEAWGYCRFGSAYDNHKQFRQVLIEMATEAGIDVTKFYRRGDEKKIEPVRSPKIWWDKYQMWEKVRG